MKQGFYTALGTPLDEAGCLLARSMEKQVQDQIDAGAAGLLVMGSMGMQSAIRDSEYRRVAETAIRAAAGRCPVFVGVMDNSVVRVRERAAALADLDFDGIVATAPFYHTPAQDQIAAFMRAVARDCGGRPLYLYDLPGVVGTGIRAETVLSLMDEPHVAGIKTADLACARVLLHNARCRPDFEILFSGLDVFDVAYGYGLHKNLDGMFACIPHTSGALYSALACGDTDTAGRLLSDIIALRDLFVELGVFRGFTCAMNQNGCEGRFFPDYMAQPDAEAAERVAACMRQRGMH